MKLRAASVDALSVNEIRQNGNQILLATSLEQPGWPNGSGGGLQTGFERSGTGLRPAVCGFDSHTRLQLQLWPDASG